MALQKRDEGFLVPAETITVVKKKKAPKVLDEETYTKDLENIIERDFFPDLPDLKSKSEYFDALEKNDIVKLREFQIKFSGRRPTTGSSVFTEASPATFETPDNREGNISSSKKLPQNVPSEEGKDETELNNKGSEKKKLSLDKYLVKNTSEDNASFAEILEETQKKHAEKHAWLYENETSRKVEEEERLALPGIETQAAIESGQAGVDTWQYKAKNALMYVPEGADFSAKELMEFQKSKPREIKHDNTRFSSNPWNQNKSKELIQQAASAKAFANQGKIGHDGKEILVGDSPQVNGYGFVATPSPVPGVNDSPLMTWGEIESTPFRIEGSDTPLVTSGPSFKIPEVPKRDKIAMELAEKASKSHRDKKERAMKSVKARFSSPSPKFGMSTSERISSMSPAAQRLATSRLGIRTHSDKALKASYTPSPSHRLSDDKTPISITPGRTPTGASPAGQSTPGSKRDGSDISSLTDNLLQLPKRKRASDFF